LVCGTETTIVVIDSHNPAEDKVNSSLSKDVANLTSCIFKILYGHEDNTYLCLSLGKILFITVDPGTAVITLDRVKAIPESNDPRFPATFAYSRIRDELFYVNENKFIVVWNKVSKEDDENFLN
jgi:hypothetical protein